MNYSKTMSPNGRKYWKYYLSFKGLLFGLIILFSSLCPMVSLGPFLFPVLFAYPVVFRRIADVLIGSWICMVAGLIEKWLGLRVVITGDVMRGAGEQSLIIMNHRTCLDWLYFWSVLVRQSGVATEKIILKNPLKHIPGAGWAMQTAGFMFLKRRWDADQSYLNKILSYFRSIDYPTQILIFPEGTDFNPVSKARSDAYAQKVGLVPYRNLLHPRTTGFNYLINNLKKDWPDAAVYDVTVGYPDSPPFPQTERDLLSGVFASSVHFHIQRYSISDIPNDSADIDTWCQDRWKEKEVQLDDFRANGSFTGPAKDKLAEQVNGNAQCNGNGNVAQCNAGQCARIESCVDVKLYASIVGWALFVGLFFSLLVWSSVVRWLALAHVAVFLWFDLRCAGFEMFQAWYNERKLSQRVKVE